jgi:uncharacterized protein YndB with AHSA1/START domain
MNDAKTIEVTIERTIPASPGEAFAAWLNPKIPGPGIWRRSFY